jgi:glucose-1-phosphate adenylyltransferase
MNNNEILAVILGGGKGTRLYPLTKYRAKPAVPIAGKFRIIDIPISNCLNSGISKIFLLTQFNTHSLHRHIYDTYRFGQFTRGFVEILAAQQTIENSNWYQGTADAVRKNMHYIKEVNAKYVIILAGDHLYRMDYRNFIETHIRKKADITIAVKPVTAEEASNFGILQTDNSNRIVHFVEKPQEDTLEEIKSPGTSSTTPYLASMGIYLFSTDILEKILDENRMDDFGKHIIPSVIGVYDVYAHQFKGYWRDIGTIEMFFKANMELTSINPPFTFYDEESPVYTHPRFLPGSRTENCKIRRTLLADGCYLEKCETDKAVIGIRSIIRYGTKIENSVIMGADYYEDKSLNSLQPIGIGRKCLIKNTIIDKNARIGDNVKIVNKERLQTLDTENYSIRDGIVVIPKNSIILEGTVI